MDSNYIYGKNSLIEALKADKRKINKIIISKSVSIDDKINQIIDQAKDRNIVYQFVPKERFREFDEMNHQGVVGYISPIEYLDLDEFLGNDIKENSKVIILDGLEDSHNVGAIIRTAVCAGFDAVIINSRRCVQVNATVEKTSAGAINYIPIIKVNSLQDTISKLKKQAYWIIATDAKAKDNYFEVDYTGMKIGLIVSSEGKGVNRGLLKHSDFAVKIPMYNEFNSLNVSNASSVVMYEIVKQNITNKK